MHRTQPPFESRYRAYLPCISPFFAVKDNPSTAILFLAAVFSKACCFLDNVNVFLKPFATKTFSIPYLLFNDIEIVSYIDVYVKLFLKTFTIPKVENQA